MLALRLFIGAASCFYAIFRIEGVLVVRFSNWVEAFPLNGWSGGRDQTGVSLRGFGARSPELSPDGFRR